MEIVTLAAACQIFKRNYKTVHYHLSKGRIPAIKVGGTWLVKLDDFSVALDACPGIVKGPTQRSATPEE